MSLDLLGTVLHGMDAYPEDACGLKPLILGLVHLAGDAGITENRLSCEIADWQRKYGAMTRPKVIRWAATWSIEDALTPSEATKAAYSGEFFEQIEMPNPDYCGCGECDACEMFPDTPETYTVDVPVSWDTIKRIMAMIRERAGM